MTPPQDRSELPEFALGFPGPLGDRLVAAVLSGAKTATTGLLTEYERCAEPLPSVGGRSVMPDSGGRPVAVQERWREPGGRGGLGPRTAAIRARRGRRHQP
ncbi:hypothetical protein ACFTZI_07335 [Streptomyces decoyicus]|uniref:hypothetical protein n=1 Tax=Streptomyces decoyicus TaxID=249567 RepID=UPI003627AF92